MVSGFSWNWSLFLTSWTICTYCRIHTHHKWHLCKFISKERLVEARVEIISRTMEARVEIISKQCNFYRGYSFRNKRVKYFCCIPIMEKVVLLIINTYWRQREHASILFLPTGIQILNDRPPKDKRAPMMWPPVVLDDLFKQSCSSRSRVNDLITAN